MATLQPLAPNRQTLVSQDTKPQISAMSSTRKFQPVEEMRIPPRDSFAAVDRKRTLPMSPTEEEPSPTFASRQGLRREGSHRSSGSQAIQDHDTDMVSDEEGDPSDNDSQDDDTEGPSKKKKKGQRFFCTEYPPCNLSFTRSEHLARHIRKHTGERPFQCHCSRRFSRLDNLRQHAQTVHINEEIPGDSLAATGTRFQRQIRTDRVRPPSTRARASTAGSQSGHRGHGRNQSTSSIASTASNVSTISSVSALSRKNSGRRPHSINFADHQRRPGLTIDTLRVSPTHNYPYLAAQQTVSGNSTPTSYYVGTPSSPHASALGSPIALPRNATGGPWADRQTSSRRLSVPSQPNLFPAGASAPQFHHPMATLNSSNSSVLGSPTSSTFSLARTEIGPDDWRRRTWHPNTFSNYSYPRPATSGLSYSQTPNEPRPAFAPQALAAAAPQTTKLPGIETFDQISNAPSTPPQHGQTNTPTAALTPGRLSLLPTVDHRRSLGHQRGVHSWDMSLHQNLTRLEITGDTPPRETRAWIQQSTASDQLQPSPQYVSAQPYYIPGASPGPAPHAQVPPQLILPSQPVEPSVLSSQPSMPPQIHQGPLLPVSQHQNQTPSIAPTGAQRTNWSMSVPHKLMRGPGQPPVDLGNGESRYLPGSNIDYQPTIIHANGYIEPQPNAPANKHTLFSSYQPAGIPRAVEFSRKPDTSGLDALVAVATSESRQLQVQR